MSNYFVRKSGNDSNAGTSAGAAWLTIDKAASTLVAGDTCYIGAGIYRELVTLDNSGSSGSVISFIGDIKGTQTGDAGLVVITAHDTEITAATRASCIDVNGKTFWKLSKLTCTGGTSFVVGNTSSASHLAYEGCEISDCVIACTAQENGIKLELNNGVTPTANGLQLLRNSIYGGIDFDWDSNGSANNNLKILIDSNIVYATYGQTGFQFTRVTNGGAFTPGGITITGNTWLCSAHAISTNNLANTTNPILIYNNLFAGCQNATSDSLSSAGFATASNNRFWNVFGWYASGITVSPDEPLTTNINYNVFLGGIHDVLLVKEFGYAPYKPLEPMEFSGYSNPVIGRGTNTYSQTSDVYSNGRELGRPNTYANVYYFDGSDAAVSDPNSVWTSDSNITDNSLSSSATCATTGSTSSNYIMAEGTNAPGSGGTIVSVSARFLADTASGTCDAAVAIYTDALGELLGTPSITGVSTTDAWSSWTTLSAPSGGWTWAKVQALEFKGYRSSASNTLRLYMIQVSVITDESSPDCGAVEANPQGTKNTTTYYEGAASIEIPGAGFVEVAVAVPASSTTISVQTRWDATYSGSKPQLQVLDIPGIADQSDTATGSSGAWEQLSCTFTPSSAGVARVRMVNQDVSAGGQCLFDDLQIH